MLLGILLKESTLPIKVYNVGCCPRKREFEIDLARATSKKLLKQIELKKLDAYISSVTLAEIVWVVYKESGYKRAKEVQSYLRELLELQIVKVIPLEESIVYRMLALIEKYNLSFVDALAVSTAINFKSSLVTRDVRLRKSKK